jgi:hypothetical protein
MSLVKTAETLTERSFGLWRKMLVIREAEKADPVYEVGSWEWEAERFYDSPDDVIEARILQLKLLARSDARKVVDAHLQIPEVQASLHDRKLELDRKAYVLEAILRQRQGRHSQLAHHCFGPCDCSHDDFAPVYNTRSCHSSDVAGSLLLDIQVFYTRYT